MPFKSVDVSHAVKIRHSVLVARHFKSIYFLRKYEDERNPSVFKRDVIVPWKFHGV